MRRLKPLELSASCDACATTAGGVCLVHLAAVRDGEALETLERRMLEDLADEEMARRELEEWCVACGLRFGRHLRDCERPGSGLRVYTIDDVIAANERLRALALRERDRGAP